MAHWTKKWTVRSFTDSKKEYVVSEGTTLVGTKTIPAFGCSCPAWRYKRVDPLTGLRPNCKHIDATIGKIMVVKQQAITEETRLLLDEWAVEEMTYLPKLAMEAFGDREI